jgi:hypothetical protein
MKFSILMKKWTCILINQPLSSRFFSSWLAKNAELVMIDKILRLLVILQTICIYLYRSNSIRRALRILFFSILFHIRFYLYNRYKISNFCMINVTWLVVTRLERRSWTPLSNWRFLWFSDFKWFKNENTGLYEVTLEQTID